METRKRAVSEGDMAAILIGFGLVAAVFAFFLLKTMSENDEAAIGSAKGMADSAAPLPTISPDEVRTALITGRSSVSVADLRNGEDFQAAHVTGSVSVSDPSRLSEITVQDDGLLVLIPSENTETDHAALDALSETGHRFGLMKDGLLGWQAAGGTVVTEPNPLSPVDRSKVTLVPADRLRQEIGSVDTHRTIVDIRPAGISATGAPEGAIRIPYGELESRRDEIPVATNIVLCAENGDEAFRGGVRLFDLGFFSVETLDGSCVDLSR